MREELTQSIEFERSRILRNPCGGDVDVAVLSLVILGLLFDNYACSRETHRPEIVDQKIENAQDYDQHSCTPLGLESDHDHHTRHESQQTHDYPPYAPISRKHKSDEQKNQQHSPRQLHIHLAIFLVHLR